LFERLFDTKLELYSNGKDYIDILSKEDPNGFFSKVLL
jgi:hypothetical protein